MTRFEQPERANAPFRPSPTKARTGGGPPPPARRLSGHPAPPSYTRLPLLLPPGKGWRCPASPKLARRDAGGRLRGGPGGVSAGKASPRPGPAAPRYLSTRGRAPLPLLPLSQRVIRGISSCGSTKPLKIKLCRSPGILS